MCFRSKSPPTLTMRAMRSTAAWPGAMRIAANSYRKWGSLLFIAVSPKNRKEPFYEPFRCLDPIKPP